MSKKSWIGQKQLTFLQLFIFPSFLSFLSKQQAPMVLCVGCTADWKCSCVCQSDESWGRRLGWLTLENTTAPVTHVGLWGLTRLYLTPRVCRALTAPCVSHTHFMVGVAPPLSFEPSCFAVHDSSSFQYRSDRYDPNRLILFFFENWNCRCLYAIPSLVLFKYSTEFERKKVTTLIDPN